MTTSPTQNYTLGRGELHFAKFKPGTQIPDGFRFIGNVPTFNVQVTREKLEHFRSTKGVNEKDLTITTKTNRTANITAEDISPDNLAIFLLGSAQILSEGLLTAQSETFVGTHLGRSYQVGLSDALPTGHRKLTTPVLKKGVTVLVLGTDYTIDTDRGCFTVLPTSTTVVDNDDLTLTFGTAASSRTQVISGSTQVEGALRYISYPVHGDPIDFMMPYVEISPNGDFAVIAENALQSIPLTIDIQTKGVQAAVYADGQPYIAS